jgi:hypothetical protein
MIRNSNRDYIDDKGKLKAGNFFNNVLFQTQFTKLDHCEWWTISAPVENKEIKKVDFSVWGVESTWALWFSNKILSEILGYSLLKYQASLDPSERYCKCE